MNKKGLIRAVRERTGLSQQTVEAALDAMLAEITKALAGGGRVWLRDFGTFETRGSPARTGCDPRTLEPIAIPASRRVLFHAGVGLKKGVAGR